MLSLKLSKELKKTIATFIGFLVQVLQYFDIEYTMHWTKQEISKVLELYNMSFIVHPIMHFEIFGMAI